MKFKKIKTLSFLEFVPPCPLMLMKRSKNLFYIDTPECHGKLTVDGVKFINFTCLKIKQNHISSCSLLIITYESILGFSYSSSFFMQIRLKKILLAVLLLKNLAKYNKEINMTAKFLLITFKQSCVIMFLKIFQIF